MDAPSLFRLLWRAISSFVDPKTYKKIRWMGAGGARGSERVRAGDTAAQGLVRALAHYWRHVSQGLGSTHQGSSPVYLGPIMKQVGGKPPLDPLRLIMTTKSLDLLDACKGLEGRFRYNFWPKSYANDYCCYLVSPVVRFLSFVCF